MRSPAYASILSEAKECLEESTSHDKQFFSNGQFDAASLASDQPGFSRTWKALAVDLFEHTSRPTVPANRFAGRLRARNRF